MKNTGAVYCVYDDSGFLAESVQRIYPLMDRIVFLVNFKPWQGEPNPAAYTRTMDIITALPDPDHKIEILSRFWATEAIQRNYGTWFLRQSGLEWCLIIDDDELYNVKQLEWAINSVDLSQHACYLFAHQIYWKRRDLVVDMDSFAVPCIISTEENLVQFNENRMVIVYKGKTWTAVPRENIICHHMSFVRTDEQMLRKINTFSHAHQVVPSWYEEKWLKWTTDMTDLHPTGPSGFRKVISADTAAYKLEAV